MLHDLLVIKTCKYKLRIQVKILSYVCSVFIILQVHHVMSKYLYWGKYACSWLDNLNILSILACILTFVDITYLVEIFFAKFIKKIFWSPNFFLFWTLSRESEVLQSFGTFLQRKWPIEECVSHCTKNEFFH